MKHLSIHTSFSKGVLSGAPILTRFVLDHIQSDVKAHSDSHWHLYQPECMFTDSAQYGKELSQSGNRLVVCGIGGSGLGVRAFAQGLLPVSQWGRIEVLDHVDPTYMDEWLQTVDVSECVFCVTSKSGQTIETLSQWMMLYDFLKKKGLSDKGIADKVVVISNAAKNPLTAYAATAGIRLVTIPQHVGGRFSILSPVGLVPMAFLGWDLKAVQGALQDEFQMFQLSLQKPAQVTGALNDAATWVRAYREMSIRQWILMAYSKKFFPFTLWAAQLVAESLGKANARGEHVGILPLPAQGVTDQHSYLQYILEGPPVSLTTFFEFPSKGQLKVGGVPTGAHDRIWKILEGDALATVHETECESTQFACDQKNRLYQRVRFEDCSLYTTSRWVVYFQQLIACMGLIMGINPYDQPGVEIGKKETLRRLT